MYIEKGEDFDNTILSLLDDQARNRNYDGSSKHSLHSEQKVREFANNKLLSLLHWLLYNPDSEQAERVAQCSYIHGNGFAKIVLGQGRDGSKLRLHFWKEGFSAEENAHCHRWGFSSLILFGEINSESFIESTSESATSVGCYLYEKSQQTAAISKLGNISISSTGNTIRTSGDYYDMLQGQLHRISGTNGKPTATLLLQCPPTKSWNTLLTDNPEKNISLNPRRFMVSDLQRLLAQLVTLMNEENKICTLH